MCVSECVSYICPESVCSFPSEHASNVCLQEYGGVSLSSVAPPAQEASRLRLQSLGCAPSALVLQSSTTAANTRLQTSQTQEQLGEERERACERNSGRHSRTFSISFYINVIEFSAYLFIHLHLQCSCTFTFSHLADAFIQSNLQGCFTFTLHIRSN